MDSNQELVAPPPDLSMKSVIANIRSGVIDAMASQIDGLDEKKFKQSIGPRNDDPKKIEDLFARFDATNLVFSLIDDMGNYLESITSITNSNITRSYSLVPAIDLLLFVLSTGKHQLVEVRKGVASHHKIWCGKAGEKCVDYEIRDAGDKGLGLFTMGYFKKGEKILAERTVAVATRSETGQYQGISLRMKAYRKQRWPVPPLIV